MGRDCPTEPLRDYRKTTSERKEETETQQGLQAVTFNSGEF